MTDLASPFPTREAAISLLPHYAPTSRGPCASDDLALAAGAKLAAGTGTMDDAVYIIRWKEPYRTHGRFRSRNRWDEVRTAIGAASAALDCGSDEGDLEAVKALAGDTRTGKKRGGLSMVGIPTATAFCCWLRGGEFPLIDVRALRAVGYWGAISESVLRDYLGFCRADAARLDLSLRDYDRALWVHGGTDTCDPARRSRCT